MYITSNNKWAKTTKNVTTLFPFLYIYNTYNIHVMYVCVYIQISLLKKLYKKQNNFEI